MSDPLTDAANAISNTSPAIKKFARLAASRIEAIEAKLAPPPAPVLAMPLQGISLPGSNLWGKPSADQDFMLDQIVTLGNGHPMFVRLDWWPNSGFQTVAPKLAARPSLVPMPILSYDPGNRPTQATFAQQAGQIASLGYGYVNLLNEPDMSGWLPADAAAYFNAGRAAIKAVNAAINVVGPSTWKTNTQSPADGFAWCKAFIEAGAKPNIYSLHLYGPDTSDRSWNNWAWLPDYRALLDGHGMASVPIICTEAGDNADTSGTAAQTNAVTTGMAAREAATVASYVCYSLLNDASPGGFGLLDSNRVKRPAFTAFQTGAA